MQVTKSAPRIFELIQDLRSPCRRRYGDGNNSPANLWGQRILEAAAKIKENTKGNRVYKHFESYVRMNTPITQSQVVRKYASDHG